MKQNRIHVLVWSMMPPIIFSTLALPLINNGYSLVLISAFFSFFIITFLLDGCKLSSNKIIRWIQLSIFTLIGSVIIILFLGFLFKNYFNFFVIEASSTPDLNNVLETVAAKEENNIAQTAPFSNSNLNISGKVSINKEGAVELSKGISSAAGQIGLGTAIAGVSAAAAKVAGGTPMQKLAIVGIGGALGGLLHVGSSAANRVLSNEQNSVNLVSKTNIRENSDSFEGTAPFQDIWTSSINEENFISLFSNNPFEVLLSSIYLINICNLMLLVYLSLSLLAKFFLNKELNLKWVDSLIKEPYSSKIKTIILKYLNYLGKSSSLSIFLIIILLFIGTYGSIHFLNIIINNLEIMCKAYISYIGK